MFWQELVGRARPGAPSGWAETVHGALGKGWGLLTPTTAWNENYISHRTDRGFALEQRDDVVLPSAAGGRHLSRARLTAGPLALELGNTHLVHQGNARASRQVQAKRVGELYAGARVPVLVGGDFNDTARLDFGPLAYVPGDSDVSTYTRWGATKATTGNRIDHFAQAGLVIEAIETRGVRPDGTWTHNPRPGDHQAVVVTFTLKE